jgi:hypothetical protein
MKVTNKTIIVNNLTTIAEAALSMNRDHMDYTLKILGYVPHGAKVTINAGRRSGHTTAARELYSYRPRTAVVLPHNRAIDLFKDLLPKGITDKDIYDGQTKNFFSTGVKMYGYSLVIIDQAAYMSEEIRDDIVDKFADPNLQTQFLLLG